MNEARNQPSPVETAQKELSDIVGKLEIGTPGFEAFCDAILVVYLWLERERIDRWDEDIPSVQLLKFQKMLEFNVLVEGFNAIIERKVNQIPGYLDEYMRIYPYFVRLESEFKYSGESNPGGKTIEYLKEQRARLPKTLN